MPSVCLYFQIHQPFRLRKYTVFDSDSHYFDDAMNAQLVRRIAERCYVPMNKLLLDLIRGDRQGAFKVALSITGTALEQFESYAPQVVQGFHALAQTRCVEFLSETYHHSLASLHSETEFREQVDLHRKMIRRLFGQTPTVFRNTELIYSNRIGALAADMGFRGVLAEGWGPALNNRSAAFIYRVAGKKEIAAIESGTKGSEPVTAHPTYLLLRNHDLSDEIAFRFSDVQPPDFPMTDDRFVQQVTQIGGWLCNLFMDYETFGEHQAAATGIFDSMRSWPQQLVERNCQFVLPGQLLGTDEVLTAGELDVPSVVSWADESRDLGAWMGNAMQTNALDELYALEPKIKARADSKLLSDWRKLTTSDHFYYMSTKDKADGTVHGYFRPYESPYDAYINYMNVLENLKSRAG